MDAKKDSTIGPTMKIKALAPWFGGKRNLAPLIVQELGEHRAYWEPFCGSMAVLLAKPAVTTEVVNDLNSHLINLARVIQHPTMGPELYRRLRRTLMHEAFFVESDRIMRDLEAGIHVELDSVAAAYHYMVCSWLGRNGTAGQPANKKGTYCVRYTQNGGHAGTRWMNVAKSIPAWRRRLRGVTILQRDGLELLERIEDAANAAIYIDPPYIEKSTPYLHDFKPEDHMRLALLLQRFRKARIVLSYYSHPMLKDLYPNWTFVRHPVSKAMSHVKRGESKGTAVEVLLINGPSYTKGAQPMLKGMA